MRKDKGQQLVFIGMYARAYICTDYNTFSTQPSCGFAACSVPARPARPATAACMSRRLHTCMSYVLVLCNPYTCMPSPIDCLAATLWCISPYHIFDPCPGHPILNIKPFTSPIESQTNAPHHTSNWLCGSRSLSTQPLQCAPPIDAKRRTCWCGNTAKPNVVAAHSSKPRTHKKATS